MKKPLVSLILPVYNETSRLMPGLTVAVTHLRKQTYPWEIIVVDDGSRVPVRAGKFPVTVVRLPENKGKGAAIARGVKAARGTYIVFSDIDFSVPLVTLPMMLTSLKKVPVVIGSRRTQGAVIAKHQGAVRESAGRVFTFLSNVICAVDVKDATCGFKGFRADTARNLFRRSKIHRWVFDTEILFLARKKRIPVTELPVVWEDRQGSKVTVGGMLGSIVDLLKIRFYDFTGGYGKP